MKSIRDHNALKENLDNYVSFSVRETLGIIILSFSEKEIVIGAMNPNYVKVLEFINKLESEIKIKVTTKQISSDEWEQNNIENNKPISFKTDSNNHNPPQNEDNNLISNVLTQSNNEKFDFFDSEDEVQLDQDDIFDDSEFKEVSDPVIAAVSSILSASNKLNASDIHAEPLEERMRIRYRVDGVLQEVYSLPKARSRAITSRIKVMSKLDIAERRLPQDGRLRYKINENILDFRVSTLPGKWGEKIVLRVLQSDTSLLKIDKLINFDEELKSVRDMGNSPYGILIVVGPTGSGKSTTLYSILNERNTPDVNIITVEDPVEYTLDGIHQVQVIREKGLDFARALRSLMRQDPDIILVGETRDKETAHTAMEAALTGHMVFTTLHANDTSTAITRLAEMEVPPYLIGSSIVGVMAQRLVRKVCNRCSYVSQVDPIKDKLAFEHGITEIRKANTKNNSSQNSNSSNLENTNNCPVCNGSGYKGRLGLYEVMKVNENIRELIMKSGNADQIKECAIKNGMRTLLNYGLELVKQQLTSLEEVERVCLLEESE